MDTLTLERALDLAHISGGDRITLCMSTRPFAPGSQEEDSTRLRNLLRTAEVLLAERGLRASEADRLLAPARALADDRPFWLRAGRGLTVLLGPEGMHAFRLDAAPAECVIADSHYRFRALLPVLQADDRFWLLAISQKHVRLYAGTRLALEEVPAEGVPTSLAEALKWDDFEKASLQYHSGSGSRTPAVFHGTGEKSVKDELLRFFQAIDHGLRDHIRDSRSPLLLAGVDYLLPIYREVNTYAHLADASITGNPEALGNRALHESALVLIDGLASAARKRLAEEVEESWGSSRTTPDPETIVPAAHNGRVQTLLLSDTGQWWGSYDPVGDRVALRRAAVSGDEDLLERAALETLEHGGSVVNLGANEMPHTAEAVALLRY